MMTRASVPPSASAEPAAPPCKVASYAEDSCHGGPGSSVGPPPEPGPATPSQSGEAPAAPLYCTPSSSSPDDGGPGQHAGSARKYRLVRLDEATGLPGRPVTEAEAAALAALLASAGPPAAELTPALKSPCPGDGVTPPAGDRWEAASSASRLNFLHHQKPGGPCDHCGASESPQWRRGPNHKPVLCNACGTRYRRTNQLGPPVPSSSSRGALKREASPPGEPAGCAKAARVHALPVACGS